MAKVPSGKLDSPTFTEWYWTHNWTVRGDAEMFMVAHKFKCKLAEAKEIAKAMTPAQLTALSRS